MTLDVRSEQSVQKDSANHFFDVYYYNGFNWSFRSQTMWPAEDKNSMAGNARKDIHIGFSKVDADRFLFFGVSRVVVEL